MGMVENDNYDHNYHYDGSHNPVSFLPNIEKAANVFELGHEDGAEELKAVSFGVNGTGTVLDIDIYEISDSWSEGDAPWSGKLLSSVKSFSAPYPGLYTAELEETLKFKGKKRLSVVISPSDKSKTFYPYVDDSIENNGGFSFVSHADRGDGYVQANGQTVDVMDAELALYPEDATAEVRSYALRIKAYTKDISMEEVVENEEENQNPEIIDDSTSEDKAGEDEVSKNELSENEISENKVSENEVSENEVSENKVSENETDNSKGDENGNSKSDVSKNEVIDDKPSNADSRDESSDNKASENKEHENKDDEGNEVSKNTASDNNKESENEVDPKGENKVSENNLNENSEDGANDNKGGEDKASEKEVSEAETGDRNTDENKNIDKVSKDGISESTFKITSKTARYGMIAPSGEVKVKGGASQTFVIKPDSGFEVDYVIVDGVNVGAVKSYTFGNVSANHAIYVDFKESLGSDEIGSIFISWTKEVSYNGNKHVWEKGKGRKRTSNDISIKLARVSNGATEDLSSKIKTVVFRNNKSANAGSSGGAYSSYFTLKMKDKAWNDVLKNKRFEFSIIPASLSANSLTHSGIAHKKNGKVKINKLTYRSPDGTTVKMKYTKNPAKSDYTYSANPDGSVLITGTNNFQGNAILR